MFRRYGNTVELYRYKIEYEDTQLQREENGELTEETVAKAEYCISDEHKDAVIQALGDKEYSLEAIDQTGNEWINGLSFDSYDLAAEALAMGEEAYKELLHSKDTELQMARYLVDLDYRLLLLEMGGE